MTDETTNAAIKYLQAQIDALQESNGSLTDRLERLAADISVPRIRTAVNRHTDSLSLDLSLFDSDTRKFIKSCLEDVSASPDGSVNIVTRAGAEITSWDAHWLRKMIPAQLQEVAAREEAAEQRERADALSKALKKQSEMVLALQGERDTLRARSLAFSGEIGTLNQRIRTLEGQRNAAFKSLGAP